MAENTALLAVPHSELDLFLRPVQDSDIDSLVLHANNFNVSQYLNSRFPYPYKKEDALFFIDKIVRSHPDRIRAISIRKPASDTLTELIGVISIVSMQDDHASSVDIGYWLSESYWGHGIMSTTITSFIFHYLCHQFPKLRRVNARAVVENQASLRVLEKAGFKLSETVKDSYSKNGKSWDEHILILDLKEI